MKEAGEVESLKNLVVEFLEVTPSGSGADNSADQDTATVTMENEDLSEVEPPAKQKNNNLR